MRFPKARWFEKGEADRRTRDGVIIAAATRRGGLAPCRMGGPPEGVNTG